MADKFGIGGLGRKTEGGKFYAVPNCDVDANAVFMPRPNSSAHFGIAEYPVPSGERGAFSHFGTFAFPKPSGWTSNAGQPVHYIPNSQASGSFAAAQATGSIPIGFEVVEPGIPGDQIYVDVCGGTQEGTAASA